MQTAFDLEEAGLIVRLDRNCYAPARGITARRIQQYILGNPDY